MSSSRSALRLVLVGGGLFALIQAFSLLSPILLSMLLILLISLAANPVIGRIRARAGGRRTATALATVTLLLILGLTGWALFEPMQRSVAHLAEELPGYWERMQKPLIKMEQKAVLSEGKLQAEVSSEILEDAAAMGEPDVVAPVSEPAAVENAIGTSAIRSHLAEVAQNVFTSFTAMAFNGAQMLVVLVTVFFGVIFTLMDPRPIFGSIFVMVPEDQHARALVIMKRIGAFVPAWAGATLLGMATVGALVLLLMWPIFGFMDALVLASIAGLLEVVPFLGPLLGAVPALLLALGEGRETLLWVVLAYGAVQALENNVILPFVMARGMRLHPVSVMLSTLLCITAFGVLGVLVAAPLVAIVGIVHDELYRKRFLPNTTDSDLDRLAREALNEDRIVAGLESSRSGGHAVKRVL